MSDHVNYYVGVDSLNGRDRPVDGKVRHVLHKGEKVVIIDHKRGPDGQLWGLSTGRRWWAMRYLTRSNPGPGRIPSPFPGVGVTTPWGRKPNNNTYWQTRRRHTGADYNKPGPSDYGDPVVAVKAGRVVVKRDAVLGLCALLYTTDRQGRKVTFWYGHLSAATPGTVKAGEPVGRCGKSGTGAAMGSHLHFEVRLGWTTSWKGRDFNPVGVW